MVLFPFDSSKNFSNAMAIADYDSTDRYMQYADEMIKENSDKSQNSNLIQKIKCNDINSNYLLKFSIIC
jgi:hypothetical protein